MKLDLAKVLAQLKQAEPVAGLEQQISSLRHYVGIGFLTIFMLVGGFGGWAATTDLSGAVLAPGTVVVASSVKKVQHPTGGVIGRIFVKNGDYVKKGDVLVRLDETVPRAQLQIVSKQMDELNGRLARLAAERDDAESIVFSADLIKRANDPTVAQILAGEKTLFLSRTSRLKAQRAQLDERIAGLGQEISGLNRQIAAKSREIELIGKELDGLKGLEAKRLVTTSKMMALRREGARLEGERAQLLATAGSSKGRVAEIEMQRIGLENEAKGDIVRELRETQGKLAELSERRTAAEDQLSRVDLKAPADGLVHQMTVFTVGGVINPAEPLMLIVPDDDKLVVEARIMPQDIDQARMHTEANIRLPAFNQRTTLALAGRVNNVAADLTRDQQTGASFYVARIEFAEAELGKLHGHKLVPGMPAEVQITTTSRSALSYFVRPVEDAFSKAFKER